MGIGLSTQLESQMLALAGSVVRHRGSLARARPLPRHLPRHRRGPQTTGARLLVTIGEQRDPAELGPLPPAVRVERWVSQAELIPHTAVMLGHAGAGSTLVADQPFNARHGAELGAAIALDDEPASLPRLEQAARDLLSEERYRDRARAIADEIQTCHRSSKPQTHSRRWPNAEP